MGFSTQPCGPIGPGYGEKPIHRCHLEWPLGGTAAFPAAVGPKPGNRTISYWARIDRPTVAEAAMVAICTLGGPEDVYLGTDESGDTPELFTGVTTITTGTYPAMGRSWHHFGFRSRPTIGPERIGTYCQLWIDGHLCLQVSTPSVTAPFDRICLLDSTARAQFCGSIQAVKIWETLLTPQQLIAEGKSLGSVVNPTGLYAFWRLQTDSDLADRSGNARDLSVTSEFHITAPAPQPPYGTLRLGKPIFPPFEPSTVPW
jgi:hypothetical protein